MLTPIDARGHRYGVGALALRNDVQNQETTSVSALLRRLTPGRERDSELGLAPTALRLLGIADIPKGWQGTDLFDTTRGPVITEYHKHVAVRQSAGAAPQRRRFCQRQHRCDRSGQRAGHFKGSVDPEKKRARRGLATDRRRSGPIGNAAAGGW